MTTNIGPGRFRLGCSGYHYDHWVGVLYDPDEASDHWLTTYAGEFDSVEINNSFYSLPEESTLDQWREQTPEDFLFVLKYSRYGSHMKRLKDAADHLGLFMPRARRLGDKLGPILVQLPPHMKPNIERLDQFLDEAPDDNRWAVEFRNEDWLRDSTYEVLRRHNAALCLHDMIPNHPREVTADWVYLRFHGAQHEGDYPHQALTSAARRIHDWLRAGLDVYAYFNNDLEGFAVHNARDLRRFLERAAA